MTFTRFFLRRMMMVIPLLVGIVFGTFMLIRVGGLDPVGLLAGPTATAEEFDIIRAELGLDQPLWAQFGIYIGNVLQGDLGESWLSTRPVLDDMLDRVPVTLELLLWGVGIGAIIGIPIGLKAAFKPDGTFDHVSRFFSLFGFSIPTYWLGLMMLFVFFYLLRWAPPGIGRIGLMVSQPPEVTGTYLMDSLIAGDWTAFRSALSHLILPVTCIAVIAAAPIIKHTRAIAIEVISSDAVRYAKASGLPTLTVRRMVLRNAATPVLTFVGTELTGLVGTTSLIEYVFAWGGLGQYGLNAIINGDFTAVQGYVLFLALFSIFVFLIIDFVVFLIEPRAELQ
ncbi:MAG: ABC transporter permease [Rhodospirillaceae bacterium]|jgi:ABC-type dipeptide/oligopeptide/nickel transport system permease component|nr:ABC transporter permease [Rhodospirillaceae bacterium]MBT6138017.1 ABC transporter permease [Rhodospirillaceae bacterium]